MANLPAYIFRNQRTRSRLPRAPARLRILVSGLMACLVITFVAGRCASAEPTLEAVATKYPVKCDDGDYLIAISSVSDQLRDGTPAQALSIILIPQDEKPGGNKAFAIYGFGPKKMRDDDAGGTQPQVYNPDRVAENIAKSFSKQRCPLEESLTQAIVDQLNSNQFHFRAREFVEGLAAKGLDGFLSTSPVIGPDSFRTNLDSEQAFTGAVRTFNGDLVIPGMSEDVRELQAQVTALSTKLEAAQQRLRTGASPTTPVYITVLLIVVLLTVLLTLTLHLFPRLFSLTKEPVTPTPTLSTSEEGTPPSIPITSKEAALRLKGILENTQNALTTTWNEYKAAGSDRSRSEHLRTQGKQQLHDCLVNLERLESQYLAAIRDEMFNLIKDSHTRLVATTGPGSLTEYTATIGELFPPINDYIEKSSAPQSSEPVEAGQKEIPAVKSEVEPAAEAADKKEDINVVSPDFEELFELHFETLTDKLEKLLERVLPAEKRIGDELWPYCSDVKEPYNVESLEQIINRSKGALKSFEVIRSEFKLQVSDWDVADERIKEFFKRLGQIRDKHLKSNEDGTSADVNATPTNVWLDGLEAKLKTDNEQLNELRRVKNIVNLPDGEQIDNAVSRLAENNRTVKELLGASEQDDVTQKINELLKQSDDLKNENEATGAILRSVLPTPDDSESAPARSLQDIAQSVVNEFERAKTGANRAFELNDQVTQLQGRLAVVEPQAEHGQLLANDIAQYLNFDLQKATDDKDPILFLNEKITSENPARRRLRMNLSAACLALNEILHVPTRPDVVTALRLETLPQKYVDLLNQMQELNGNELWEKGLFKGLSENWLHHSFRADLLLKTYYSDDVELESLREAVSQICLALTSILREFQVQILPVQILGPSPIEKVAPHMWNADPELRKLSEVKMKVNEYYQSDHSAFVIDVIAFSYKEGEKTTPSVDVTLMNPEDWRKDPAGVS